MATCPGLAGEIVNLGHDAECSMLHLAEVVQRLSGSRSPIVFSPLPQDDPKRRRPDLTKARRLLGYEPRVALEEGLRRTIVWFARSSGEASRTADERVTHAVRI